jgi:acetylornithine aminotransferase
VANEVTTGLGRTGRWIGADLFGLTPDIMAFGKILGNGYPVSAVVMKESVADRIENMPFRYVQSHQNDPLGCAVAKEVIAVLEQDNLVSRSMQIGEYFTKCLHETVGHLPATSEIRGVGLMLGLQLTPECFDSAEEVQAMTAEMYERGFIIGAKPESFLLRFMPPFTITEDQISGMCSHLAETLEKRSNR